MALLACPLAASCVTQNVHFEPPDNYPPSIETPESLPGVQFRLGTVIRLSEVEAAGATDAGAAPDEIELRIEVRDPNVDERLNYRVFVNFDPTIPGPGLEVDQNVILPDSQFPIARRPDPIRVRIADVETQACSRIEILVVGEDGFRRAPNQRQPNLEGDLATATWFVIDDRDGRNVSFSQCNGPWI